ncbi:MAG TPA: hypothetical protein IGS53_22640 [Leptolyngbyaceae cyanobacterium M33_DOE_097]|nr:hypothetical protein [Leptolyngbyaceae cyanobacterium M33_DOE_097]
MPSVTRANALTYHASVSEAGSDLIIITTSKLGLAPKMGNRLTQPSVSLYPITNL